MQPRSLLAGHRPGLVRAYRATGTTFVARKCFGLQCAQALLQVFFGRCKVSSCIPRSVAINKDHTCQRRGPGHNVMICTISLAVWCSDDVDHLGKWILYISALPIGHG
jgi:hypothetical protein